MRQDTHQTPKFSFVSPVYRCSETLGQLAARIDSVCRQMQASYELILVDDGCPENSWSKLKQICTEFSTVRAVRLTRNFGQHAAIEAGLSMAEGEWIIVLDCDLQDRPEEVPALYAKALQGYKVVQARRVQRHDSALRRLSSRMFYKTISWLTGWDLNEEVANFGIYHHSVIKQFLAWNEQARFFPLMIQWLGFERAELPVVHEPRRIGRSSYTFGKLLILGLGTAISFSDRPLRLIVELGFMISVISGLVGIVVLVRALFTEIPTEGWASLILSLWFLSGVIITLIGVSSLYLGRVLAEAKGRPNYIINEMVKTDKEPTPES